MPVLREICSVGSRQDRLSEEEVGWLRFLSKGGTVAALARRVGRSERTMYRLLHRLYGRLGVNDRFEAMSALRDAGYV